MMQRMIQFDFRSRKKHLTATPTRSVVRNPTPPINRRLFTTLTPQPNENRTYSCYCWKWKLTSDPGFHKFLSPAPAPGPKEKRKILSKYSGSVAISGVDPSGTVKNWVIGFIFPITARSASALAVAFFRLLEPFSYVRLDILK